ncbi:MAG: hypothetical protein ACRCSK_03440 [Fusobacteriaceae bacterium]
MITFKNNSIPLLFFVPIIPITAILMTLCVNFYIGQIFFLSIVFFLLACLPIVIKIMRYQKLNIKELIQIDDEKLLLSEIFKGIQRNRDLFLCNINTIKILPFIFESLFMSLEKSKKIKIEYGENNEVIEFGFGLNNLEANIIVQQIRNKNHNTTIDSNTDKLFVVNYKMKEIYLTLALVIILIFATKIFTKIFDLNIFILPSIFSIFTCLVVLNYLRKIPIRNVFFKAKLLFGNMATIWIIYFSVNYYSKMYFKSFVIYITFFIIFLYLQLLLFQVLLIKVERDKKNI